MFRASLLILSIALLASCGLWEEDKPRVFSDSCAHLPAGEWVSLGLETEVVTALASDPRDPGILYAGTGTNPDSDVRGQLFKSTDCGQTWRLLETIGGSIHQILIDPTNPSVIYAVNGAVFVSRNAGNSWTQRTNGMYLTIITNARSIAVNPRNNRHLLASTAGFNRGLLYESVDGGNQWSVVADRLPTTGFLAGDLGHIQFHHRDTGRVLFANIFYSRIVTSQDAGITWTPAPLAGDHRGFDGASFLGEDSDRMIVSSHNLVPAITRDGGQTWSLFPLTHVAGYRVGGWVSGHRESDRFLAFGYNSGSYAIIECEVGMEPRCIATPSPSPPPQELQRIGVYRYHFVESQRYVRILSRGLYQRKLTDL